MVQKLDIRSDVLRLMVLVWLLLLGPALAQNAQKTQMQPPGNSLWSESQRQTTDQDDALLAPQPYPWLADELSADDLRDRALMALGHLPLPAQIIGLALGAFAIAIATIPALNIPGTGQPPQRQTNPTPNRTAKRDRRMRQPSPRATRLTTLAKAARVDPPPVIIPPEHRAVVSQRHWDGPAVRR